MNPNDTKLSKYMSMVLRHHPDRAGLKLDKNGWADVQELIAGINKSGKGRAIDMATLERIVADNDKQRYSFNDDRTKIRANQGHSIPVNLELEPATPPDVLYHGTATRYMESIKKSGLISKNRQYVHLSSDIKTAFAVGSRHGYPVVLKIDAKQMAEDGYTFYLSVNKVWLCDNVPWKYMQIEGAPV